MRKFIHVDMDAFYVSVEIRDNPILLGQPVAVGGASRNRGVLSTCNYVARKFGLHSAMPTAVAVRKCPNLVLLPGRMSVYKEVSLQIRSIFNKYTELVEPLSLDEAYLDVTDSEYCNGSATLIAKQIRETIFQETQLTASAGIAPLKFVAKVASDLNKPNGQYVVAPEHLNDFIANLPLYKIPGVGKVTYEKLKALGWLHGADIRNIPEHKVVDQFGKFGSSLWKKCQGVDYRGINLSRERKSVGVERTFSEDSMSIENLEAYMVNTLMPELTKRAKPYIEGHQIDKLGVKVKFKDFSQTTKEQKHTKLDNTILLSLLHQAVARGKGKPVRLLGVQIGIKHQQPDNNQLSFEWL